MARGGTEAWSKSCHFESLTNSICSPPLSRKCRVSVITLPAEERHQLSNSSDGRMRKHKKLQDVLDGIYPRGEN